MGWRNLSMAAVKSSSSPCTVGVWNIPEPSFSSMSGAVYFFSWKIRRSPSCPGKKMKDEHQILYQKWLAFSPNLQLPAVALLKKMCIHGSAWKNVINFFLQALSQINKLVLLSYFKMLSVNHLRLVSLSQKKSKEYAPPAPELHTTLLLLPFSSAPTTRQWQQPGGKSRTSLLPSHSVLHIVARRRMPKPSRIAIAAPACCYWRQNHCHRHWRLCRHHCYHFFHWIF